MAGTRSSSRLAGQQKSSPTQSQESPKAAAGTKRKAEPSSSPSAKRGRKSADRKEQKTIEDTMDVESTPDTKEETHGNGETDEAVPQSESSEHDQAAKPESAESKSDHKSNGQPTPTIAIDDKQQAEQEPKGDGEPEGHSESKTDSTPHQETSKMDDTGKIEPTEESHTKSESQEETQTKAQSNGETAVEPHDRDEETPSSILEKGVIYFFFRGRVGIDDPSTVDDIARSYMVLRPIPHGAKIGDGPIGDGHGKCRLLALPKKVLPVSGKDRFMTFVEKSKTTFEELKNDFMSASDYATQTAGTRHTPPVTPVAEGVYALTTTGRESHLAYMITIPQELGEVQKDLGLREQGSFITSAKNPQYAGPANTNLPESPDFPKEILDEFRSLRWAPLQPKYLDYENMQFLLIGESSGIDKAVEQQDADKKAGKDEPMEELEKLEGEDEIRIKNMKGDDAVFADLGISKKDYPQVPSTWN